MHQSMCLLTHNAYACQLIIEMYIAHQTLADKEWYMETEGSTIDLDILPVKYFACKFFVQSKFHRQTLVTIINIGQHTLHKIFYVFNFHQKRLLTKFFTDGNFTIYCIVHAHAIDTRFYVSSSLEAEYRASTCDNMTH